MGSPKWRMVHLGIRVRWKNRLACLKRYVTNWRTLHCHRLMIKLRMKYQEGDTILLKRKHWECFFSGLVKHKKKWVEQPHLRHQFAELFLRPNRVKKSTERRKTRIKPEVRLSFKKTRVSSWQIVQICCKSWWNRPEAIYNFSTRRIHF